MHLCVSLRLLRLYCKPQADALGWIANGTPAVQGEKRSIPFPPGHSVNLSGYFRNSHDI